MKSARGCNLFARLGIVPKTNTTKKILHHQQAQILSLILQENPKNPQLPQLPPAHKCARCANHQFGKKSHINQRAHSTPSTHTPIGVCACGRWVGIYGKL